MKNFRFIFAFVLLFLSGCTTTGAIMTSWVGHSVDDVTAIWGAPAFKIERGDGGYTYTWTRFYVYKGTSHECRKTFVTDSNRIVQSWSYAGCRKLAWK